MSAVSQASIYSRRNIRLPRTDYLLLVCAIALLSIGLVMVASASITFADRELGKPFYYATKQFIYIGMGIAIGLMIFRLRLSLLESSGMVMLLVALALLLIVLIPGIGVKVNGSMRWLSTGLFRLQVSEPAKLFIMIYMASYLARHGEEVRSQFSGFLKPLAVLVVAAALLR